MNDATKKFDKALRQYEADLHSSITKIQSLASEKKYALSAFNGGNRDVFNSEREIEDHYSTFTSEAQTRGKNAAQRVLLAMKEALDMEFTINVETANQLQAVVTLLTDDEALIRFVSDPVRCNDFTVLLTATQCTDADGKTLSTARAIKNGLDAYESSLSEIIRKTKRYTDKGLSGDANCAENWSDWIQDAVNAADDAYQELQDTVHGKPAQDAFTEMMMNYFENKSN